MMEMKRDSGLALEASTSSDSQTDAGGGQETILQLSKRQMRKQVKVRQWQEAKQLRREKRRQKKQEFKARKRQRLEQLKTEATEKGEDPSIVINYPTRKKLKSNSMQKSSCKVGVCVDMNFNDLMIEKDMQKCIKQVSRCYGINRRYENPVQFYITSLTGRAVEVMDDKHDGWKNWDVYFHESSYLELEKYPKENIVYLTAESENVLKEIDESKLYVIGGLVDHNSKKGLCHKLAIENGVQHARLPLDQFVDMKVRKVLSIVHVFDILGKVAQKRPWEEVIMDVLPQRSNAKLKRNNNSDDDSSGDDDASEINTEEDYKSDAKLCLDVTDSQDSDRKKELNDGDDEATT